ncbi:transporter substrate-binding domain-containing protein [Streptococcus dentiloxodontae]
MTLKRFTRLLLLSVAAFAAALLLTSKPSQADTASDLLSSKTVQKIVKAGVLKVGVKQDVPNFGYYSAESGNYEGMEIDLAKKIADKLGVKVEFTPVTAQTREALMDNGTIDLLIATYTITEERQASYAISNPYYYDEIGFLVRSKSNIQKISDLDGMTIGVAQGASTKAALEEYAKAHDLTFNYVQLGSYPELAISLYADRIDAFSVDKSILTGYESKNARILDEGFSTQEYGVAAKKSNQDLIDYVNTLLTDWKSDGSLNKLYDKYDLKPAKADDN